MHNTMAKMHNNNNNNNKSLFFITCVKCLCTSFV